MRWHRHISCCDVNRHYTKFIDATVLADGSVTLRIQLYSYKDWTRVGWNGKSHHFIHVFSTLLTGILVPFPSEILKKFQSKVLRWLDRQTNWSDNFLLQSNMIRQIQFNQLNGVTDSYRNRAALNQIKNEFNEFVANEKMFCMRSRAVCTIADMVITGWMQLAVVYCTDHCLFTVKSH